MSIKALNLDELIFQAMQALDIGTLKTICAFGQIYLNVRDASGTLEGSIQTNFIMIISLP